MKIIINNTEFEYNIGCKVIKAKYGDECPKFFNLPEIWNEIVPITFKEIASSLSNIEQRRIAISALGIQNLVKEVKPKMIGSETLKKITTFVTPKGELVTKNFKDTYKLYEVEGSALGLNDRNHYNYIECKDTSTDREYLIWIDATSVWRTNNPGQWTSSGENYGRKITPIQAIAWTIQTNIREGEIEKIVRQGDCIMIKKKSAAWTCDTRHLTEEEYKELVVLES